MEKDLQFESWIDAEDLMKQSDHGLSGDESSNDEETWLQELKQLKAYEEQTDQSVLEFVNVFSGVSDILRLIATGVAGVTPTKNNVLTLNQIIICILKQMENQVKNQLKRNMSQQDVILMDLRKNADPKLVLNNGSASFLKCGMPFFKTPNGWIQPKNPCTLLQEKLGFSTSLQHFTASFCWSAKENVKLQNLVVSVWKEHLLKQLETKLRQTKRLGNDPKTLKETSQQLEVLRQGTVPVVDSHVINWMQIAASMGTVFSAEECLAQWSYIVNPSINRTRWTKPERTRLNELAKKHYFQSWDKIAQELGTGRSGLLCCIAFQRTASRNLRPWTPEEDAKLKDLVQRFSTTSFRPYVQVSYLLEDRTLAQIRHRYRLFLSTNKTILSLADEKALLKIAHAYPHELDEMCKFLPTRSLRQLKRKHDKILQSMPNFSCLEDQMLLEAFKNQGKNWELIAKAVPGRTPAELKNRHRQLLELCEGILKAVDSKGSSAEALLPRNPAEDVWPVLQLLWEPPRHSSCMRYGQSLGGKMSVATQELLRVLEFGGKFLFGPRFAIPREDKIKERTLAFLMQVCEALNSRYVPNTVAERLIHHSRVMGTPYLFEKSEEIVYNLKDVTGPQLSLATGRSLVPPNLLTLLGTRVIGSAKGLLTGQAALALPLASTAMDPATPVHDRPRMAEAKELLRSRMMSLFFLSLCMSKVARNPGQYTEFVNHPKSKIFRPQKTQSKLKKRKRAQHLNEIRWKKRKENDDDSASNLLPMKGADSSPSKAWSPKVGKAKMIRVRPSVTKNNKKNSRWSSQETTVEWLDAKSYVAVSSAENEKTNSPSVTSSSGLL